MNRRLTITACRRCSTPTIRCDDIYTKFVDLPALTPLDEGRAWLAGQRTFEVRTYAKRSYLYWRNPSPIARRALAEQITAGQPHQRTVLAEHTCPGLALQPTDLLDWQPVDRAGFYPPRPPRPDTQEVPF